MSFALPKLNYATDALVPYITKQTIDFHYGKHHQTYVNNLNNLVPGTQFENASLEQIIREADGPIFNNGAQIWNHTFYFESFSPAGQREPKGLLADGIIGTFGSFEAFKEQFTKSAVTLFGSGWTWLVKNAEGKLEIIQESNAGNPLKEGINPSSYLRCMGTCLLSRLSEQETGIRSGILEYTRLESNREPILIRR